MSELLVPIWAVPCLPHWVSRAALPGPILTAPSPVSLYLSLVSVPCTFRERQLLPAANGMMLTRPGPVE